MLLAHNKLYAYVGANPTSLTDPLGWCPEDVANAWTWLQWEYPELTNGVTVAGFTLLDRNSGNDGLVNPWTDLILIANNYYTDPLDDAERSQLLQTLAHEALHLYVDSQLGGFAEYLAQPDDLHNWIYQTSADIANYQSSGQRLNSLPPSISHFPVAPVVGTHF